MRRELVTLFLVVLSSFLGACTKEQKVIFEYSKHKINDKSEPEWGLADKYFRIHCYHTYKEKLTDYTSAGWRIVSFSDKDYAAPTFEYTDFWGRRLIRTGRCLGREFVIEK